MAELGAAARQIDGMIRVLQRGRRAHRGHRRPRRRPEPPDLPASLDAARPRGAARQQLPRRDGQRGPRRADRQDRPGQRADPARRLRLRRPRGGDQRLHRRADRVRLSALSRRHHAEPPALAPAARRLPCRAARLDPRQQPRRPDEPRDLPRRRGGGRRRARSSPRRGAISGGCSPASDAFYARFAGAIEQFGGEGGWWRRLPGLRGREAAEIDLKKLGIFPLVHGVRTLALQYRRRGPRHRRPAARRSSAAGPNRRRARARPRRRAALPDGAEARQQPAPDRRRAAPRTTPSGSPSSARSSGRR